MNIYVDNLPPETSEEDLRKAFEVHGKINSITLISDKFRGNPLGFGFVEMPGRNQAQQAIDALNRKKINGRTVIVSETSPRLERRRSAREGAG